MTSQDDAVKVDIQPDSVYDVQDALTLIPRPQSMQVEPSDPIKASQEVTVLIKALPPVLIVHLNRFHYDTVAGGVVKNRKHVQFSAELEIPPVASDIMVPTAGRPMVPARYTLDGVLYGQRCKECVGAGLGTERTSASERPPSRVKAQHRQRAAAVRSLFIPF
ncbi:hypothetical protein BGY98DRAFT_1103071 [Russula aff. rugulosa BPL654]|nr:hypothetical protein BGY98DRAFT_1103071 [Russula aff. rugulosa BPL654]